MYPTPRELIGQLGASDWFANVGGPVDESSDVARVSSWGKALKLATSRVSRNAFLEGNNVLTQQLHDGFMERYRGWNDLVKQHRPSIEELVSDKLASCIPDGTKISDQFCTKTILDVSYACMELEYSDLIEPAYGYQHCLWYTRGHMPVGWEGDFPEGRLIVF